MATGAPDLEDFIAALRQHPEWRDRLRDELVGPDLRSLPTIVRELAEAQQRTEERIAELVEAQQRTEARLAELVEAQNRTQAELTSLTAVVRGLEGRMGNVEGELYEFRWLRNAASRLGAHLRRAREVALGDIDLIDEAYASGALSRAEWDDLASADAFVTGTERSTGQSIYAAIELSKTVDANDVARAARRAALLARHGVPTRAYAGGQQATRGAVDVAASMAVTVIVDSQEPAA